jgi:hypothetical protein
MSNPKDSLMMQKNKNNNNNNDDDNDEGNLKSLFGKNGPFYSVDVKQLLNKEGDGTNGTNDTRSRNVSMTAQGTYSTQAIDVNHSPLLQVLEPLMDYLPTYPPASALSNPWTLSPPMTTHHHDSGSGSDGHKSDFHHFKSTIEGLLKTVHELSDINGNDDDNERRTTKKDEAMKAIKDYLFQNRGEKSRLGYGTSLQLEWLGQIHEDLKSLLGKRSASQGHLAKVHNQEHISSLGNNGSEDDFYFKQLSKLLQDVDVETSSSSSTINKKISNLNTKKKIFMNSKPHSNYFKKYKKNLKKEENSPPRLSFHIPTPEPVHVGTLVKHKKFGYTGVIIAWESRPSCNVSSWDGVVELEQDLKKKFKVEYEKQFRDYILEKKKLSLKRKKKLDKKMKDMKNINVEVEEQGGGDVDVVDDDDDDDEISDSDSDVDNVFKDTSIDGGSNIEDSWSKLYNKRPFYMVLCDEDSEEDAFGDEGVMGIRYFAEKIC